jgi:hypothetical protein
MRKGKGQLTMLRVFTIEEAEAAEQAESTWFRSRPNSSPIPATEKSRPRSSR